MALTKCAECGTEVSDTAVSCPKCGYDLKLKREIKQNRKAFKGCLIIFLIAFLCLAGFIAIGIFSTKTSSNITGDKTKRENWAIGKFVDNFGEKTSEKFIHNTAKINGAFSNSATNNSNLKVDFIISKKDGVAIELYEYGSSLAHFLDFYEIKIQVQDANGTRTEFKGAIANSGKRIYVKGQEQNRKILAILRAGGIIKFRINVTMSGNVTSNYAFDVNTDGFDVQYNNL